MKCKLSEMIMTINFVLMMIDSWCRLKMNWKSIFITCKCNSNYRQVDKNNWVTIPTRYWVTIRKMQLVAINVILSLITTNGKWIDGEQLQWEVTSDLQYITLLVFNHTVTVSGYWPPSKRSIYLHSNFYHFPWNLHLTFTPQKKQTSLTTMGHVWESRGKINALETPCLQMLKLIIIHIDSASHTIFSSLWWNMMLTFSKRILVW